MFRLLSRFVQLSFLGLAAFMQVIAAGAAQTIPNHIDPSAYEDTLDLSLVPAIRFLTSPDFPPFNYKDASGEVVGFNIELAEALCVVLDADCTLQSWPWGQMPKALEDGQGDAIVAGLMIDAQNGRRFNFSQSYLQLPGRFLRLQKGAVVDEFNPHQVSSIVGARRGSSHQAYLKQHFPNMTVLPFDSDLDVLAGVQNGIVDLAFVDGMRTSIWLNQNDCCDFVGGAYFSEEFFGAGLSVAVSREKSDMLRAINLGLRRLSNNGKLDELYLKWFPVGFY